MTFRAVIALLAVTACSRRDEARPFPPVTATSTAAELALRVSDSVAIWFTSARVDTSASGSECRERVMEIRVRDRTIPVPLLYTGETPTITTDSTVQVHLWRHCVPADLYRVNLKTGQPTRAGA